MWISGAFHKPKGNHWRYYYNTSGIKEPVSIEMAWKAPPRDNNCSGRKKTKKTKERNLVEGKRKRKVANDPKGEKSNEMMVYLIIVRVALAVEEKME